MLGGLFSFKGDDASTSELVVFITPRIVITPEMSAREQEIYDYTGFSDDLMALTTKIKSLEREWYDSTDERKRQKFEAMANDVNVDPDVLEMIEFTRLRKAEKHADNNTENENETL